MEREKNVLVSLTLDEAKYIVDELENNFDATETKTIVKILYKFYESIEYVENN